MIRRPKKRQKLPEAVRRADIIMEAARKRFMLCGYEHTKVEDIAADAGLTKGGLYFYFPDKQAIFRETIVMHIRTVEQRWAGILESQDDSERRLSSLFAMVIDYVRQNVLLVDHGVHGAALDLMLEAHRIPEFRSLLRDFYRRMRRDVTQIIEEGRRQGKIRDIEPAIGAVMAVSLLNGLVGLYALDPEGLDLQRLNEEMSGLFARVAN